MSVRVLIQLEDVVAFAVNCVLINNRISTVTTL